MIRLDGVCVCVHDNHTHKRLFFRACPRKCEHIIIIIIILTNYTNRLTKQLQYQY